jgi:hypothetical protein
MSRAWHRRQPEILEGMKNEVRVQYPNLHFYPHDDRVEVRGTFPIIDDGVELDRYSIEITLLRDYPESLPIVRETGGKIPHHADNHMSNGVACLFVPDERWRICPPGTTLLEFLNNPVRNYFLGHAVYTRTGEWPLGQRAHGAAGIYEYYAEMLGTTDETVIAGYLDCLSRQELKGHWLCPCRSGKRLRACHRDQIIDLRKKIPPAVAYRSWTMVHSRVK